MDIDDNDEHPKKHAVPINLTDEGMDIDDNDEHPEKQQSPITLTIDGIDIDDNDEHSLKQQSPMILTHSGISSPYSLRSISVYSMVLYPSSPPSFSLYPL